MKRFGFIVLVFALGIYLVGCGKQQENPDALLQEPISLEALSTTSTGEQKTIREPETTPVEAKSIVSATSEAKPQAKLEPLPPQGPYKPAVTEIQAALKNAGFYTGNIDGKMGPMTKKAVENFQKANNLTVDGKVGPKTWSALSKYLTVAAEQ